MLWKRHSVGRSRSEQKREQGKKKKKKKACRLQNKEMMGYSSPTGMFVPGVFLIRAQICFIKRSSPKKKSCVCVGKRLTW